MTNIKVIDLSQFNEDGKKRKQNENKRQDEAQGGESKDIDTFLDNEEAKEDVKDELQGGEDTQTEDESSEESSSEEDDDDEEDDDEDSDDDQVGGGGSDGESVSTTRMLSDDPLFLVLAEYFINKKGENLADILTKINKNLSKLVSLKSKHD